MSVTGGTPAHAVARIGRYTLVQRLAKGGFGEVHLAIYSGAGGEYRHCVVKMLLASLAGDQEATERFVEEARVLVSLSHPNIVQILEFGRDGEKFFIAMEYVEGVSLSVLLARCGKLPLPVALLVARHMLAGLEHAHAQRDLTGRSYELVHRDVSPSNVLISCQGDVKLADFGLARRRTSRRVTDDGIVIGKLAYLAPELLDRTQASVQSDIYAVGVCLCEMLIGERLLKIEGQPLAAVQAQLAGGFEPPSRKRPEVSPHLDRVCLQAIARNPAERLDSAAAMAAALDQELARLTAAAGGAELDGRAELARLATDVLASRPKVDWAGLIGALPAEVTESPSERHRAPRPEATATTTPASSSDVHQHTGLGEGTVRFEMLLNETRGFGPAPAAVDAPAVVTPWPPVPTASPLPGQPVPAPEPAADSRETAPAPRSSKGEDWRMALAGAGVATLLLLLALVVWALGGLR
jgi:serine/threonine-protein kinase